MKVLREGHKYELSGFENHDMTQQIQFIEKEPEHEGSTKLVTIFDDTTNEEVLQMLINRMQYLQGKFPADVYAGWAWLTSPYFFTQSRLSR